MTSEQLLFQFAQTATYAADHFLTADCNLEAYRWITDLAAWPSHALVLHGPARCGKSHLAHIWAAEREAVITDATTLMSDHVPTLAERDVVVERADMLNDQRALFHLFNLTREEGRALLMMARRPPAAWQFDLPDLASRIAATPAVGITQPDTAFVAPLMVKLCADRQLSVPPEVIQYVAPRIQQSFETIEKAVAALDYASVLHRKRLTIPIARQALATALQGDVAE